MEWANSVEGWGCSWPIARWRRLGTDDFVSLVRKPQGRREIPAKRRRRAWSLAKKNEDRGWGNWSSIPRRSSSRTGGGRRSLIRSTRQEMTAGEMRLGVRGRSISRQEVFRGKWSPTDD